MKCGDEKIRKKKKMGEKKENGRKVRLIVFAKFSLFSHIFSYFLNEKIIFSVRILWNFLSEIN